MRRGKSIFAACVAALVTSAIANPDRLVEQGAERPSASTMQGVGDEPSPDFGPTPVFFQAIDGSQISPRIGGTPHERGSASGAYYCAPGGSVNMARGQMFVPHGVQLGSFRAWMFDDQASASVTTTLESVCQPDFAAGEPTVTTLATVVTTQAFAGGPFSAFSNAAVGAITDNQSCTYRVTVAFPEGCTDQIALGVQKARVSWQRFIPNAPPIASFGDVPVGSQFYREVEALAASGITAGCTPDQFCPSQPLTRLQMAAFLARALGLPPGTIADPANP